MIKNKKIKKFLLLNILGLFTAISISLLYVFYPTLPDSIDNRIRDYFFILRGEIPNSDNVVIVDIDEESLKEVGQWPWSRPKVAELLEKLTLSNVAIIGFDIVFAEPDKSSPHRVFKKYGIEVENTPNYDELLGQTVANTPTILGYIFKFEEDNISENIAPEIPAVFVERNKTLGKDYLFKAKGTIVNIPEIQNNSFSSGFFNNTPDSSGIIRNVPLVISYDNIIYPSLSLEIVRILTQSKKVVIDYDKDGVQNITLNNLKIPTDRHGRLVVNFRGAAKNFKYYSAKDILNETIDKSELEGKIVLIGTSAVGLLDLRATAFDSVYPGVEVHANVIDNILEGDFLVKASWLEGVNILVIFVLSIITILLISYTPFWLNPFIAVILLGVTSFALFDILFSYGYVLNIFFPLFAIIISATVITLINYFFEVKKKEAIKKKFASKVSPAVMEDLLKQNNQGAFQVKEKEITIFFSDVRSFTKISEEMGDAKALIEYLNKYMEPMSNIIIEHEGTIDKYIGDAIMAYWNAPADISNHADKAVKASLKQIQELENLNYKLKELNQPSIDIGIGINTGLSVVGEMGSVGRSDYTIIGDAVNIASRVESLCKYYGSKLNISNFTKEKLEDSYTFRFLDLVKVKGKDKPIEIWQVLNEGQCEEKIKQELTKHNQAIELYKSSKFEDALNIFKTLLKEDSTLSKNIYNIYITRCEQYLINPPENFDGVYEHNTKG